MKILALILFLCAVADIYCAVGAAFRRQWFNAASGFICSVLCNMTAIKLWTGVWYL